MVFDSLIARSRSAHSAASAASSRPARGASGAASGVGVRARVPAAGAAGAAGRSPGRRAVDTRAADADRSSRLSARRLREKETSEERELRRSDEAHADE